MKLLYVALPFAVLMSCGESSGPGTGRKQNERLFQLLDAQQTGIDFVNKVADEETFNILTYRNFYNGGGIAIGDINNDSLPDLYFTANQGKNKLYLNKGNMRFEDITATAGVGGSKAWSTGVTMADVNADGLLDIYVCNSGDVEGSLRENELFINNGDLTFSERAEAYNLHNKGYSTHAAFFDYDLDGDLDCYILNNSFKDPGRIELYRKVREIPSEGGDKLMRNDGETFTDVTESAGIFSSDIGFGLGVAVSDLNGDRLPDLYISNDFWERDYLYINEGSGKFSEQLIDRINYCSTSSMGADIADLNNDGSMEIFTTDMLPADNERLKTTITFDPYHLEDLKYRANFHYQMTQNCLHLNDGEGTFQEIALMAGVSATDWSWGALIFDFENDGRKDIFVSNGILKDIMSMDFREFLADAESRERIVAEKGKFDYRDFISLIPAEKLKNYAFCNTGDLRFQNLADSLGMGQPSFSNGSAYGDLDNDGDADLVVNNINSAAFVYRNDANLTKNHHYVKVRMHGDARNPFAIGAKVTIRTGEVVRTLENYNTRGFQSSIEPVVLFGVGAAQVIDELRIVWPDQRVQTLTDLPVDRSFTLNHASALPAQETEQAASEPLFREATEVLPTEATHAENRYNDFDTEILLPRMLSTEGPRLVTGDVNGDRLDDFVLLGAAGDPDKLFVQRPDGTFTHKISSDLVRDAAYESTCGVFLDQDGDGDLDLIIGSGGNELGRDRKHFMIRSYTNDGTGQFTSDPTHSPKVIGNFSTLEVNDIDGDGDPDLFLGARTVPGNYGLPPRSFLLMNDAGVWNDAAPPSLANVGMVTDATWSDVDDDGDKDLIVVGDWMAINIFQNDNGLIRDGVVVPDSEGWWTRVEPADLDGDGDVDFVLGNWGLNTKFRASKDRPITMFVNDFDDNGKSEFIINWYPPLDEQPYPFATKPELTSQLPGLRKRILKYEDYASQQYESLFTPEIRSRSIPYVARYLESAVLWNEGTTFRLEALPREAQVSPVFGVVASDLDADSYPDIWLGGNFYALKPQVGRHDASRGVFLKGSKERTFEYQRADAAGIHVEGEVRDAVWFEANGRETLLVARNNARMMAFLRRPQ